MHCLDHPGLPRVAQERASVVQWARLSHSWHLAPRALTCDRVPPQTWPGLDCSRELSHLQNVTCILIPTRFCCLQATANHFCVVPGHLGFTVARTTSASTFKPKLQYEPSSFRDQFPSQVKQALCRTQEKAPGMQCNDFRPKAQDQNKLCPELRGTSTVSTTLCATAAASISSVLVRKTIPFKRDCS